METLGMRVCEVYFHIQIKTIKLTISIFTQFLLVLTNFCHFNLEVWREFPRNFAVASFPVFASGILAVAIIHA